MVRITGLQSGRNDQSRPDIGTVVVVDQGDKYGWEYVNALNRQVKEQGKYKFVCLTDETECLYGYDVQNVALQTDLTGWWSKLELFAPWNAHLRPFLYLDLDVFVTGDLKPIFNLCDDNGFWMLRDFLRPEGGQSSMMFIPKNCDAIWGYFIALKKDWLKGLAGDQDFLEKFPFARFQDYFEGHLSYKADNLGDNAPTWSTTIHFHGYPKPYQTTGWAKERWDKYKAEETNPE